jgi:hypothetical protein
MANSTRKHGYVWAGYPNGKGGPDICQFENGETEHDPAKWANPRHNGPGVRDD